jgi:hypothetical protein
MPTGSIRRSRRGCFDLNFGFIPCWILDSFEKGGKNVLDTKEYTKARNLGQSFRRLVDILTFGNKLCEGQGSQKPADSSFLSPFLELDGCGYERDAGSAHSRRRSSSNSRGLFGCEEVFGD